MRTRTKILSDLKKFEQDSRLANFDKEFATSLNTLSMCEALVEITLDIRDQNERIVQLLSESRITEHTHA